MNPFAALKNLFLPCPIQRTPAQQHSIDVHTAELKLYHFPVCPYCLKVRWHIRKLGLNIELRNAQQAEHQQPLRQEGGMEQVPCLRIHHPDAPTEWLYESDAIIHYLQQRFSA